MEKDEAELEALSVKINDNPVSLPKEPSLESHQLSQAEPEIISVKINDNPVPGPEEASLESHYTFDLCIVFEMPDNPWEDPPPVTGIDMVASLNKAGLNTRIYRSFEGQRVFCLVGCAESRLEKEALRTRYDLLLDSERSIEFGFQKGIQLAKVTKKRDEHSNFISTDLWSNIYGRFDNDCREIYTKYYDEPMHMGSVFRQVDRVKLTISIIEADTQLRGAGLAMGTIARLKNSHFKAMFPLHDQTVRNSLEKEWTSRQSYINQPLSKVRNYLGEEIALYFAFLQYYTRWMIFLFVVGLIWFIMQSATTIREAKGLYVFGLIIAIWSAFFLDAWKRKQAYLRVEWGMTYFKEKEQPRPEFHGEWIRSPIDGKLEEYFPFWQKILRVLFSGSVVTLMILLVITAVIGVFLLRGYLVAAEVLGPDGAYVASVLNALQIYIFNVIYTKVAYALTAYENHRTDTSYQNSLITKNFLFKFINSYNSLFYMAFFRFLETRDSLKCSGDKCLTDLRNQLIIIFGSMIVINNFLELGVPYLSALYKKLLFKKEMEDDAEEKLKEEELTTDAERQFRLGTYDSTLADYDEIIVQFGYVILFIVSFPLTPLLAIINNVIEHQVDSRKLLKYLRRPEPRGAASIGAWSDILSIISFVSVITNLGIAIFYSTELDGYVKDTGNPDLTKAIVFGITEHLVFVLKFSLQYFIPEESEDVVMHRSRQEYLVDVLINEAEEESIDEQAVLNRTVSKLIDNDGDGKQDPFWRLEDLPETVEKDDHVTF